MQIIIQSPHVTPTEVLTKHIHAKIGKLAHFYEQIETARVFLKIEKSDINEDKVCEISLAIPSKDLFVKRRSYTFEDALSQAIDALHREIEKLKTKIEHQLKA